MVVNVTKIWGKLQGWLAIADKRKRLGRTIEWLLALAGPIVAYYVVFNRYEWESQHYSKWGESWSALVLLIPMVGPVLIRLFSGTGVDPQKRLALVAVMVFGPALAITFRPHFGGVSFMGFFVPMALYALAAVLWIGRRNKKLLPLSAVAALLDRLRAAVGWRNKKLLPLSGTRKRAKGQTQA